MEYYLSARYGVWREIRISVRLFGRMAFWFSGEEIYKAVNKYKILTIQVLCFMVGAIFAPNPNNSDQFLATWCKVKHWLFLFFM